MMLLQIYLRFEYPNEDLGVLTSKIIAKRDFSNEKSMIDVPIADIAHGELLRIAKDVPEIIIKPFYANPYSAIWDHDEWIEKFKTLYRELVSDLKSNETTVYSRGDEIIIHPPDLGILQLVLEKIIWKLEEVTQDGRN